MDEPKPKQRPSVSQLSKTPSWVMLGFILGAGFVMALPRRSAPPPARPITVTLQPHDSPKPAAPTLTTIEAVFSDWATYAVWSNDKTQVAMWNAATGEFSEFYEVRRVEGNYYFRSIARLTNREIRHGKPLPAECPLRFTETEEQYREWREQRYERPAEVPRPNVPVPRTNPQTPPPSAEVPIIKPDAPTPTAEPERRS